MGFFGILFLSCDVLICFWSLEKWKVRERMLGMVRVEAFRQVGGYNSELIAGEDPDLAVRIRQHGWIILRIEGV